MKFGSENCLAILFFVLPVRSLLLQAKSSFDWQQKHEIDVITFFRSDLVFSSGSICIHSSVEPYFDYPCIKIHLSHYFLVS